ncbi:MAG: hypothetical protein IPM48_06715 [Saprospiraceae bacterium]|nr:hypothetical protein [Saprospiraceae bacterium]
MKNLLFIAILCLIVLWNKVQAQNTILSEEHKRNEVILKDMQAVLNRLKEAGDPQTVQIINKIKNHFENNRNTAPLTNLQNAQKLVSPENKQAPGWLSSLFKRWSQLVETDEDTIELEWTPTDHRRIKEMAFENIYYEIGPNFEPFEHAYLNIRFSPGTEDEVLNVRMIDPRTNKKYWIVENLLLSTEAEIEGWSYLFTFPDISPAYERYRFEFKVGRELENNANFRAEASLLLAPQTFVYHVPLILTENDQLIQFQQDGKGTDPKAKPKHPAETQKNHSRINQMGNEDLNSKVTPSDSMACGPAAAANSLEWLNKYDKNLKGKNPDDRQKIMEKLKRYMARNDSIGVRVDSFITGKLALIDEHKLPIHVKYQSIFDCTNDTILKSRFSKNTAQNKGGKGKEPDWEWFKSEMEKGEDVEIHVGYYEVIKVPIKKGSKKTRDSLVRTGGHWQVATAYTHNKNGQKYIHVKDDQDQSKKGGTRKASYLVNDYHGMSRLSPDPAKKMITLWESTVSESYDSTINQKDPVGMKKDFNPYTVVPFPWTHISLIDETTKPDYPFATIKKTKIPWIWIGTGAVGAGVLTWVLTRDKETGPVDTTPVAEPIARCKDAKKYLDPDGHSMLLIADIDAGSTSGAAITHYQYEPKILDCQDIGMFPVILTVTDAQGRMSSCVSNVMVSDGIPPITNCRDLQRDLSPNGDYHLSLTDFEGMMTDNCKSVSLSFSPSVVQCHQGVVHTIHLTGTDASGNQSSCSVSLTLNDRIPPTISCIQNLVEDLNSTGIAEIPSSSLVMSASDNCGNVNVMPARLQFNCNDIGTRQQIFTATDESGNTASCQVELIIRDLSAPSIQCPGMQMVLLDRNGRNAVLAQDLVTAANDNCIIQNYSPNSFEFSCADVGEKQISIEVTDQSGNSAACQILLQIKDQDPPTLACQNMEMLLLDEMGAGTIPSEKLLLNLLDNCGIKSLTPVQTSFNCLDIGNQVIQLTATDVPGNTSSCEIQIVVKDQIPPTLSCQSAIVRLGPSGRYTLVESDVVSGKSDNCEKVDITFSKTEFDCNDIGDVSIIVTATDVSGNSSNCATNVQITGESDLLAKCKNKKLHLDSLGKAELQLSDIDDGSGGGCLPFTLTYDRSRFDCLDTMLTIVQLIATDTDGNTSACTAQVTVVDTIQPEVKCQDAAISLDGNGRGSLLVQEVLTGQWDNCKIAKIELSKSNFTCSDIGSRSVQLTATDAFGNPGNCQLQVEVLDEIPPIARCRNIELLILNPTGPPTKVRPEQVDAGSTDNCRIANRLLEPDEFSFEHLGPNLATLTVIDASGNESSCIAVITVIPGLKREDPDSTAKNGHGINDPHVLGNHVKHKNKLFVFLSNLFKNIRFYPIVCPDCK